MSAFTRMGITIPSDLKSRMDEAKKSTCCERCGSKRRINWSAVAARAFEKALEEVAGEAAPGKA